MTFKRCGNLNIAMLINIIGNHLSVHYVSDMYSKKNSSIIKWMESREMKRKEGREGNSMQSPSGHSASPSQILLEATAEQ